MNKLLFVLILCSSFLNNLQGQSNLDSLGFTQYLQIVKVHHPFMQRASIVSQQATANLLAARGNFDPTVFADVSQKYFSGDQYYSYINTGVSIPTYFGLTFYSGYDQSAGEYINPQYRTPANGLAYAGAQLTLGQGLLIDKRRADLSQAKLFTQIAEQERVLLINQLLLDASLAYWDWYAAYNIRVFIESAYAVSEIRYNAIRQAAIYGERALLDTLEMNIQLQNLFLLRQDYQLQEQIKRLECSVFLWAEGNIPVELNANIRPTEIYKDTMALNLASIQLQLNDLISNHPEIQRDMLRIDQQQIDLRLKREMLKPLLNLKYNAINEPIANNLLAGYALQNYTWGLDFAIPILLRKERAEVQIARLKLQDMSLGLDNKRALILMKTKNSLSEWQMLEQQLVFYKNTVNDITRMLDAERSRFDNGESSVFLINTREFNLINAQVKLFEMVAKSQKAIYKTYFSLALLI